MHTVIIGGTGHVGTYLVPRLVELGHDVTNISRQQRDPYLPHGAWERVRHIQMDRKAEEASGSFGSAIRDLKPDIVIDMICFEEASCRQLVDALRGQVQHFLHCGTVWVHGPSIEVPVTETQPRRPFGDYGVNKAAIEAFLIDEARRGDFPATVLHPGHIVGPGHIPINPAGHRELDVFTKLARGEKLALPNIGMETLHHVHADDVAQAFTQSIAHWSAAVGESFHTVSPAALTLRGFAESVAGWFGKDANLEFLPWDAWKQTVSPESAGMTWDHIAHSPNASIEKARRLIDYNPRYTSLQAVHESVMWLIDNGQLVLTADAKNRVPTG